MAAQRFFRFTLRHVLLLMMIVGAFFTGRRTIQTTVQPLKERAFSAEILRFDLLRTIARTNESQRLNLRLRIRASEVLKMTVPPCEVIQVVDGDTIRVSIDGEERTIVFDGIDCPEVGQPFGDDAHDFTSTHCRGPVRVIDCGRDDDGNIVAIVISGPGDIINDELVRAGLARLDHKHESPVFESAVLRDWQVAAQESKQGLWTE